MLDSEILELVAEIADHVLQSNDDLVSGRELFAQPRDTKVSVGLVRRRSRANPISSDELCATDALCAPRENSSPEELLLATGRIR